MTLYERLLGAAREQDYQLVRPDVDGVDEGLTWMRGTHGGYSTVWFAPGGSDEERRRAIRHWRWLRARHQDVWQERGGKP